jgi:hypothetical protein
MNRTELPALVVLLRQACRFLFWTACGCSWRSSAICKAYLFWERSIVHWFVQYCALICTVLCTDLYDGFVRKKKVMWKKLKHDKFNRTVCLCVWCVLVYSMLRLVDRVALCLCLCLRVLVSSNSCRDLIMSTFFFFLNKIVAQVSSRKKLLPYGHC